MAKTQQTRKRRLVKKSEATAAATTTANTLKKHKLSQSQKNEESSKSIATNSHYTTDIFDFGSDSDSDSDSDDLPTLLEPYTKDQLIDLISAAAVKNHSLYSLIHQQADKNVSHRKIFIYGIPWDSTRQDVLSALESFGEIEDCSLVLDKITGKSKGYAFVVFKNRKGAIKALKEPKKKIGNRIVNCQLASVGPVNAPANGTAKNQDLEAKKIFVSNVPVNTDKEKLKAFFSKFGEIETGPNGFDKLTGESGGFVFIVYKTVEGAKKALKQPYKIFEGQQLHCHVAIEKNSKSNVVQGEELVMQQQQQVQQLPQEQLLAATTAAQNLALFGQHPWLNQLYGGLIGNPGAASAVYGMINPLMAGATSPIVVPTSQVWDLGGSNPMVGAYGQGKGLAQDYPNTQVGQDRMGKDPGAGGSLSGYSSHMCCQ